MTPNDETTSLRAATLNDKNRGRHPQAAIADRRTRKSVPFSLRCGAMLIDYTVAVSVAAFATLIARLFSGSARLAGNPTVTFGYLVMIAVVLLNFIVLAGYRGQTLGKWATGLRIQQTDGTSLSFARALVRHLVGYPLSLLTFGLGFLIAALNGQDRALHDFVAGTIVVRATSEPARRQ